MCARQDQELYTHRGPLKFSLADQAHLVGEKALTSFRYAMLDVHCPPCTSKRPCRCGKGNQAISLDVAARSGSSILLELSRSLTSPRSPQRNNRQNIDSHYGIDPMVEHNSGC